MYKSLMKFLTIVMCLIIAFGCSAKPQLRTQEKNEEKNAVKVAVISADTANDDFVIFKKNMEEKASEQGLKFLWMDGGGNVLKQEDQLKNAEKEKVKLVIIQPVDAAMLNNTIKEMQNKGIKFICLNLLPKDIGVEAYISPDFARAGEMQAQQLVKQIKEKDKINVLILSGNKKNKVYENILAGNRNILEANNKIGELWVEEIENKDAAEAYDILMKYLAAPNPPDAVLAHSPEYTEGMLKAVDEFFGDSTKNILTFGMGTQKEAIEAIKKGKHNGEIDFMPDMFAQIVLKAAKSLSNNEVWEYDMQVENGAYDIPARITPMRLIGKENIKVIEERVKELEEEKKQAEESGQEKQNSNSSGENEKQKSETEETKDKKKTVITIKTKDGQEFKMDISGEIVSVEMKGEENKNSEDKENSEEE